jgi:hypothetical protein
MGDQKDLAARYCGSNFRLLFHQQNFFRVIDLG